MLNKHFVCKVFKFSMRPGIPNSLLHNIKFLPATDGLGQHWQRRILNRNNHDRRLRLGKKNFEQTYIRLLGLLRSGRTRRLMDIPREGWVASSQHGKGLQPFFLSSTSLSFLHKRIISRGKAIEALKKPQKLYCSQKLGGIGGFKTNFSKKRFFLLQLKPIYLHSCFYGIQVVFVVINNFFFWKSICLSAFEQVGRLYSVHTGQI